MLAVFVSTHASLLLLLVLAQAGLAAFARALPWPARWIARKPLACPVCMSGWAGFAVWGAAVADGWLVEAPLLLLGAGWFAGIAVGALIFSRLYPPPIELPGL